MISSLRFARTLVPAIMLLAIVASFAGPSIASTIRLLDGDEATSAAASETHLPLDMAATPEQMAESIGESVDADGPTRVLSRRTVPPTSQRARGLTIQGDQPTAHGPLCGLARLCVYRL